ncbi:MAG TPA: porphobilinogen synthase [Planctomycetota bacterium]|nr:porphobilinogen synthase [Planctomycetota bacterium]
MIPRPRRLRATPRLREALAETHVLGRHLIQPHFVLPAEAGEEPVPSMPGVSRLGLAPLVERVRADLELGLGLVLLFGLFEEKDAAASSATDPDGVVPRAVRRLKAECGDDLCVITDVCLCGSTDHGHCGVLADGRVQNDASLPLLAEAAVAHAAAGADFVAPSDMMDGRVAAIRAALDEHAHSATGILSYSSKFASAFYGPFRDAADSAPQAGDRRSYQLDPRNAREALRESLLDEAEDADLLMVKPALAYLDVVAAVRASTTLPLVAYNVSGEYSMVKAAAQRGWIDEGAVVRETLLAMRRAGADLVVSYHAREALEKGWIER